MKITSEYLISGQMGKKLDEHLTPFVQQVVQSHELPGLSIGVVADHQTVYARGFGVQSLQSGQAVTMKTLFHMASISKPFVATAVMQLVEQGKIQLDAPVVTYLPYFSLDDPRFQTITIQQMLSHVSGMPDVDDYEWERPQYDEGALERFVRSIAPLKMIAAPGEKFAYSNMAFECLGDVIAKVSGMSFDDYVKVHILNPAGMPESTFLKPEYLPENWAAGHLHTLETFVWDGYPYHRAHGPSSTLHSSAIEMCNWAITNLKRGSFAGSRVLQSSSYDLLWTPRAEARENEQVGLSWFLGKFHRINTVGHGGGDTGFNTMLILLPEARMAAVALCNLIPAPVERLVLAALECLLDIQPAPIPPFASLPVCKTLRAEGLQAAAAQWEALQKNHPDEYDFSLNQFDSLFFAVSLNRVQDAEEITSLCARVLSESDLKRIEGMLNGFKNEAAQAALEALRLQAS